MISIHKVHIYDRCGGLIEGLDRGNQQVYKNDINEQEWGIISAFYQDIHFVIHRLASKAYTEKFLKRLRRECTEDCYLHFLKKIPLNP